MPLRSLQTFAIFAAASTAAGDPSRMRLAEDALASGLWEVATLHLEHCLAGEIPNPSAKAEIAIRLAESRIRDGKPAAALDLLKESFVTSHPDAPFWTGQALAATGKFADAIEILSTYLQNPSATLRVEAAMTTKNLQLALGNSDAAIATLSRLAESPDPGIQAKARLHQAEILLDLGQPPTARALMPPTSHVTKEDRPIETLIEAFLALAEERPVDAATGFQSLIDLPRGQSSHRHQLAAIGLADALFATSNREGAVAFLLAFMQEHQDSPILEPMFQRLAAWMPNPPTALDPILVRLAEWIPPSEIPSTGLISQAGSDATSAWPTASSQTDFATFSLFTRATGLLRIGTPEAVAEARLLLNRIRVGNPSHPLVGRALFEAARRSLSAGDLNQAFFLLDLVKEQPDYQDLRGRAAFVEAAALFDRGDIQTAASLFADAAKSLEGRESQTAALNAALSRLTLDPSTPLTILQTDLPPDNAIAGDLEFERALALPSPADRRAALEEFLTRQPTSPRVHEARLAAAEASLSVPEPDLSFARAQLDTLASTPEVLEQLPPARVAMLRLRISDLAGDGPATIDAARAFIDNFPGQPVTDEAAIILGRNLFEARNYNDARLVLEKLAQSDTDPQRAQAAALLAARSAALVPTSQSRQEALGLFDKIIEAKGPLAPVARLEKSRLMIDMNRLTEAAASLRTWFDSLDPADPLHLPAGLLLGEAIYAQGGGGETLAGALAIYDKLLSHAKDDAAVFNRIQYLRGRTLEQLPDPEDPSRKREKEAFVAYYSVLETTTTPPEWHYFELCGFRSLALLEKAGRWSAAIACARRIASFNGPRAEEAANRANQLQLKHMIWED